MRLLSKRRFGVLAPVFSIPGRWGIGGFGPDAVRFADFLSDCGASVWQILPIGPTEAAFGHSPYSSPSAFAGDPLLISPEALVSDGLLDPADLADAPTFPEGAVDYKAVSDFKRSFLQRAFERFKAALPEPFASFYARFCTDEAAWLDEAALFAALKAEHGRKPWTAWPVPERDRHPEALERAGTRLNSAIERFRFEQALFFYQEQALRRECAQRGIALLGDLPIFVAQDGPDVWSHRELFELDETGHPTVVAGCPPDYFSPTGQRWGNPCYRWSEHERTGFSWWKSRFLRALELFDAVRVDHFRGFCAAWQVPASESTARNGRWVWAPGEALFRSLSSKLGSLPVVAEDLGVITDDVRVLMDTFGFPGMKVLQFAFGSDLPTNPYIPHNHVAHCVVYPGTHDNDTALGWWENEADAETRYRFQNYVGHPVATDDVPTLFLRMALSSVARLAVVPLQDLLGLGSQARLNHPGSPHGNWTWRARRADLESDIAARTKNLVWLYGRTGGISLL